MKHYLKYLLRAIVLLVLVAGVTGCATTGPGNKADPLEPFNRAMFKFNDAVDTVALKPAATVYRDALPTFVQTGVGNFFGNLADVWTAVNNLLQGKVEDSLTDVMRVAVNSTFGLLGLLDIGSEAGLPKHKEDFGQTLGKWGVKSGPYVMLPLFGPSTLRDTLAMPIDLTGDPWGYTKPSSVFAAGSVLRVVDLRAATLDAANLVEDAALDRYEFIRDAFLQRRESKINDGASPKDNKDGKYGKDGNVGMVGPSQSVALVDAMPVSPAQPPQSSRTAFLPDTEAKLAMRQERDREAAKLASAVASLKFDAKTESVLKNDTTKFDEAKSEETGALTSSEPDAK